jgi:chromosome segregation ATPase
VNPIDPRVAAAVRQAAEQMRTIDPSMIEALGKTAKQFEDMKKSLGGDAGFRRLIQNWERMAQTPDAIKALQRAQAQWKGVGEALARQFQEFQVSVSALQRARSAALEDVAAKASVVAQARRDLEEAVREGSGLGLSLRELAQRSRLSHETVRRIIKTEEDEGDE